MRLGLCLHPGEQLVELALLVGGLVGGGLANQEKLFGVAFSSATAKMKKR